MTLRVVACGMTTAIGLTAPAACAVFRARLDSFRETRFVNHDGNWILGAEVPLPVPTRGITRLTDLLLGPLRECLEAVETPALEIPLLICVVEHARAGRTRSLEDALSDRLAEALGYPLAQGPDSTRTSRSAERWLSGMPAISSSPGHLPSSLRVWIATSSPKRLRSMAATIVY